MLLKVGENAPTFSLPDADMETIDLADCLGKKRIVLFFYGRVCRISLRVSRN